jgi:hypothetical protein
MILSDEEKRDVYTDTIDATDWSYIDYANAIERAVLAKASQQVQGDADNQLISMGMDQPVSMYRAVSKLIEAADILLNQKNYDGTGHELITEAKNQAKGYLRSFRPLPAPKQEPVFAFTGGYTVIGGKKYYDLTVDYRIKDGLPKGYYYSAPPQAAAIPKSNNVWLDALYQSANALVRADERNTGNEPSVSVYYRAAEEFIKVSSDWPKFGHLSAAPKPEGEQ